VLQSAIKTLEAKYSEYKSLRNDFDYSAKWSSNMIDGAYYYI
jgi:hypothetical protein